MVDLDIHQPVAADIYYDKYNAIESHNKRRCEGINFEKRLETHSRDWCVNLIILALFVVNNYNAATKYLAYEETSHVFFCDFSE